VTKIIAGELGREGFMGDIPRASELAARARTDHGGRPAAYEVYHFQPVTWLEESPIPAGAGYDLEIALHRHSVGRKPQSVEQVSYRQPLRDFLRFAVQMDGDQNLVSALGAGGGRMGKMNFAGANPRNDLPMLILQQALELLVAVVGGVEKVLVGRLH
jgi:hypothetical protein